MAEVVVTGGSGFVGSWVVIELLRQGYQVRTTVRDLRREEDVRAMIAGEVDPGDRLTFFAADLLSDDGWDRAVTGADYVVHVASPMPTGEYRGQDVITPAREGTRRVLEAALRAGVKRVVATSSTAAASPRIKGAGADEAVWTDLPPKKIYDYPRAKTLAEADAWAFIRAAGGRMELTTVLPSSIQGPVLGRDYSASVDVVGLMLKGKMPALPRIGFGIVDVRDLATLHVKAMLSPVAAGQRFIGSGDFLWFADIAGLLRDELGPQATRVPTRSLPDIVVRLGGLFNAELAQLAPNLGVRTLYSSVKAERMLDWRSRPASESIIDTARSLIERGLI
ncbi:NAD-dependent epimerase/dehydratase family protein [uncultured Sphingomonas sp.]|uniref:NAD-dependent epimerase/dehydratase family protein n=1 Tax=uncultured Sphingomonas sp. TaxID=158754 RepID=UPI0035C955F0